MGRTQGFSASTLAASTVMLGGLLAASLFPAGTLAAGSLPGQLIFASNRTGNYEIYRKDLTTGAITNLTNNPADDMNPQVSPDNSLMAFYSDRAGNQQIYQLSLADPADVVRLTHDSAYNYDPVYMPDGRVLYKSDKTDGLGDIWIMNADGSNPKNLTSSMRTSEEWKPEPISNSVIIFTSRSKRGAPSSDELYTLNILTGVRRRLTNNKVADWFPDSNNAGTKVAFISQEKPSDMDSIYTMDPSGKNRQRLINPKKFPGDSDDPSWSADGQYITFVNNKKGTYDIYVMEKSGANIQPLEINAQGHELSPIFIADL